MAEVRYVPVAVVARPHGIQGEIRLKIYNQDSELLHAFVATAKKPAGPVALKLRLADKSERPLVLTSVRDADKAMLVRIQGVADRNGVELLRGAEILVPRDAFPEPEEGEFYACDLEGARAMLEGKEIGKVTGIQSYPTCDALLIMRPEGLLEVPLVEAYIASVNVAEGVVDLRTIDGLS
ncbi:MAG: ribosome maturation factor RimM [Minicystis sp.]